MTPPTDSIAQLREAALLRTPIDERERVSIVELIDMRSNSASLPTKCFTVANTPWDCTPRT